MKPKFFQFWHNPATPDYVKDLAATWIDKCPEFHYHLFDDDSSREFISRHFGERHLKGFLSCALPAMRADLLRLCALFVYGGVYSDADQSCRRPLYPLYQSCGRGCLLLRIGIRRKRIVIPNGLIIVREPGDQLIGKWLSTTLDNIEARASSDVWSVTGPGVLTRIWENPDDVLLFKGFTFLSPVTWADYFSSHPLACEHWSEAQQRMSIFAAVDTV